MSKPEFVYVTYIKTTPEKLWHALTDREMNRKYWFDAHQESDWKPGSAWKIVFPDGRVADSGEIIEIDPPKRIVIKWRNEFRPDLKAEGYSHCTMEIEPADGAVKLTITHVIDRETSEMIKAVSGGWPKILSNLKSLLETGDIAMKTKT
ncbi:MAG: SRPBCC family protein [Bradyrhizobium sp.]